MSAVLAGLSAALDITEGHPRGHAARVFQMFGGPDEHATKRAALMSARPYRAALAVKPAA